MRNINYFKDKKVTIVGLARSGAACAWLLDSLGARVSVTELKDNQETRRCALQLAPGRIRVELGRHTPEFIHGQELVVVSPGVGVDALPVAWARDGKIPVISEIEVAWKLCSGAVIAVTGSSGKTTVTTLIARTLQAAGKKTFVLGNIGDPFSGQVANISADDYVCLEASSFQLEGIRDFRPKVAVMLNLGRNHLDRHKDMQEYVSAKKRIFLNQDKTDFLVYNHDDALIRAAAAGSGASLIPFRASGGCNPNLEAVSAVAGTLGIDKALVQKVFRDFKGLPHRMEEVEGPGGVRFVNDSKATTAESTIWALNSINAPVILIAGGKDKGVDYGLIKPALRPKAKLIVLIGEAAKKIGEQLAGVVPVEYASGLVEALNFAYSAACPGECVLLSPMCSSFDQFCGYEERGEVFKKAVASL